MSLTIDRDTASRLGISPQAIDDTLYDAFGQRQVSTIFTQLNLYRVILEVKPEFQQNPQRARPDLRPNADRRARCRSSAFVHDDADDDAARDQPPGAVPVGDALVQPARRASRSATRSTRSTARADAHRPAARASTPSFPGTAQAFHESLASEPILILAALITVYIVLGVLYESYIHPITILSTLPSAGVGALLALIVCRTEFSVIALIGIVLLIGIVKKNAIMMIDFALEAERDEGLSPRGGDLQGVPAALPADHDDDDGGAARRPAARARHRDGVASCGGRSASRSSAASSSRRC